MKKGFTLAEVLIALTIIGTISALTIPSIINTYKYKLYTSQLNKAFSQISTSVNQIINDEYSNHPNSENSDYMTGFYATTAGYSEGLEDFLNSYFKKGKNCTNVSTCMGQSYKKSNGTALTTIAPNTAKCINTINGASLCMYFDNSITRTRVLEDGESEEYTGVMVVIIDVNGQKDPNIVGLDTFAIKIDDNGSLSDIDSDYTKCNTGSTSVVKAAAGCFAKYLKNGQRITKD